jgi:hypothetical protein
MNISTEATLGRISRFHRIAAGQRLKIPIPKAARCPADQKR